MPKVLPASRSARGLNNVRKARLRSFARPSNMDRLLTALYAVFEEQGDDWISVDVIHKKVEAEATTLGDTLGKRSAVYRQSCLHTLRRNRYIEYKPLRANDESEDHIRLTKNAKKIFEAVKDALMVSNEHTQGEEYRLRCDSLRSKIQPKSRRIPTRAELDRENLDLEQENFRLTGENGILRGELEGLRMPSTGSDSNAMNSGTQGLEREMTLILEPAGEPESAFTASMYTDEPIGQSPSLQPILIPDVVQSLSRHDSLQTPARQQNAASFYPTPETPRPNHLRRQESHLLSPVSPVRRLSRTPSAYIMPGTLDKDSFDDGEQDERDSTNGMNVDCDEDNEQLMARDVTSAFNRHHSFAGTFSGDVKTLSSNPAGTVSSPLRPDCDERERQTANSRTCEECDGKEKLIGNYKMTIEEQKGHIQDLKSVMSDQVNMLLEKAKEIRLLKALFSDH